MDDEDSIPVLPTGFIHMDPSPLKEPPTAKSTKTKRATWYTVKVVTPPDENIEEKDIPVLLLQRFSSVPFVCFDKVKIGATKICQLLVKNPFNESQYVTVEKLPQEKGFTLDFPSFTLEKKEERILEVGWTPLKEGNCREVIYFRTSTGCKTQVILLGTGEATRTTKKKVSYKSSSPRGRSTIKKSSPHLCTSIKRKSPKGHSVVWKSSQGKKLQKMEKENSSIKKTIVSKINLTTVSPLLKRHNESDLLQEHLNEINDPVTRLFALKDAEHPLPSTPLKRKTFYVNSPQNSNSPNIQRPILKEIVSNGESKLPYPMLSQSQQEPSRPVGRGKWKIQKGTPKNKHSTFLKGSHLHRSSSKLKDPVDFRRATFIKKPLCNEFNDSLEPSPESSPLEDSLNKSPQEHSPGKCSPSKRVKLATFPHLEQKDAIFNNSELLQNPLDLEESNDFHRISSETVILNDAVFPTKSLPQCNDFVKEGENVLLNSPLSSNLSDSHIKQINLSRPQSPLEHFKDLSYSEEFEVDRGASEFYFCSTGIKSLHPTFGIHQQFSHCSSISSLKTNPFSSSNETSKLDVTCSAQIGLENKSESKGKELCVDNEDNLMKNVEDNSENVLSSSDEKHKGMGVIKVAVTGKVHGSKQEKARRKSGIPIQKRHKTRLSFQGKGNSVEVQKTNLSNTVGIRTKTRSKQFFEHTDSSISVSKTKPKTRTLLKGVAQISLSLIKPVKTSIPRHPNPYAAQNMYYDERWMEKQELGFTRWLNFVLTPPEGLSTSTEITKVDAAKMWVESLRTTTIVRAPTKEDLSFKAYTAIRCLNRLRRAACLLYQSESMVVVLNRLEIEIEMRKIAVRKDRAMHADVGIKKKILELLLCYNPLWLRIGLETIYGEILPLQSNGDVLGLSHYIVRRLLNCPDISAKFAHPSVPHLYTQGYEEALKKFTVKKFLLLVYFLDRAKSVHLIDHNPCLFCKNAEYKSSRELLLAFSREYLSGEGDITRHLRLIGYIVDVKQTPLEEFDYAVTNIAVDLRCGLRLGRILELLLQQWSLCCKLRIPAISRLQKIHNNDIVLQTLAESNCPIKGGITSRDIVDGHRERTLNLLWQIICKTQIEVLLDKKNLKNECEFLVRNLKLRIQLEAMKHYNNESTIAKVVLDEYDNEKLYSSNEILALLLQWCQVVCAYYGVKVDNFTVSFSDGQALCYLIHHYHPTVLRSEQIRQKTTLTHFENLERKDETDDSYSEDWMMTYVNTNEKSAAIEELLANERENLKLAFDKCQELGGIPIITRPFDMSNTIPDEKVVITLVTYLNARLMDLSQDIRAARVIQLAWRKRHLCRQLERFKLENNSAIIIQNAVRKFLKRQKMKKLNQAAIVIQSEWRCYMAKKEVKNLRLLKMLQHQAKMAIIIQSVYRGYKARESMKKMQRSAIILQANIRRLIARGSYQRKRKAAIVIQQHFRAFQLGHSVKLQYIEILKAVVTIQSNVKSWLAQKSYSQQRKAAIVLQASVRRWLAYSYFHTSKSLIIKIQQKYKAKLKARQVRMRFLEMKKAVIILQSRYRGLATRRTFLRMKQAIIKLQSVVRGYLSKKQFSSIKRSVNIIEKRWRATLLSREQRKQFLYLRSSVILIQSTTRGFLVRKYLGSQKLAAIVIQKHFRMFRAKRKYINIKKATATIQKKWKATLLTRKERQQFLVYKFAALKLQAYFRGNNERCMFLKQKHSALTIQAWFRMACMRKSYILLKKTVCQIETIRIAKIKGRYQQSLYIALKKATVVTQARYRGTVARKEFIVKKQAVVLIQTNVKGYLARRKYLQLKSAAIFIQQRFRANVKCQRKKQEFLAMKHSVIVLQSAFRGKKDRKAYNLKRNAAIIIQAAYKAKRIRKEYKELLIATKTIQKRFRDVQKVKEERKKFLHLKNAAIVIQNAYRALLAKKRIRRLKAAVILQAFTRGFLVRKKIHMIRVACCTIQSFIRMHQQKRKYLKLKETTLMLQRRLRSKHLTLKLRMEFLKLHKTCIIIQAFARGTSERKKFLHIKNSAIKIQAVVRGYIMYKRFIKTKNAAIVIQKYYRAWHIRLEQQRILITQNAAITIQAAMRGWKMRNLYCKERSSCIIIQASFRRYLERKNYLKIKNAAVVIQQHYRSLRLGREIRKNYQTTKSAVIVIQAYTRSWLVRQKLRKKNEAATIIQTYVKTFLVNKQYKITRAATIKIQQHYRSYLASKKSRKDFLHTRYSAILIQSHFRGYLAKKRYSSCIKNVIKIQSCIKMFLWRTLYKKQRKAVVIIQSNIRMYLKRKQYLKIRWATVVLQKYFHAVLISRTVYLNYHYLRGAAITIQAWWRSCLVRRYIAQLSNAARVIQTTYLSWRTRQQYVVMKKATVFLQRRWRQKLLTNAERQKFLQKKAAAVCLQSAYRSHLARKHARTLRAACKIKNFLKCLVLRRQYLRLCSSTIRIQAWFKGILARRKYCKKYAAALIIQQHMRAYMSGFHQRQKFLTIKQTIITVQAAIRGYLVRKVFRQHVAARNIQTWYRSRYQQSKYKEFRRRVIYIQSWYRSCKTRHYYLKVAEVTVMIQRKRRALILMRHEHQRFLAKRKAAIYIQRWYRMLLLRKEVHAWHVKFGFCHSCIQLSSHSQLDQMRRICKAVVIIQTAFRGYLACKKLNDLKDKRKIYLQRVTHVAFVNICAIRIQKTYRAHVLYKLRKKQLYAAHIIQTWFRSCLQRIRYLKMRRNLIAFQHAARCYIHCRTKSAIIIQSVIRSWLIRRRLALQNKAATTIQAAWHGYIHRCKEQNKKIIASRKRIQAAAVVATDDKKLCNRTKSALSFLLLHNTISQLLASLEDLDVVTRLSSLCCEIIAKDEALETLFFLIRTCNRSVPHMDIIKLSSNVLLNLAKYEKTVDAVWKVEGCINTVFDVMKIFREKGFLIFTKMCTLLWIFAQDPHKAKEMKSSSRVADSICSFHFLTMRKHKMEEQRKITKTKLSSSKLLSSSMCQPGNGFHKQLPTIQPDWVLGKNVMREFGDPVTAICAVMKSLGLKKKI